MKRKRSAVIAAILFLSVLAATLLSCTFSMAQETNDQGATYPYGTITGVNGCAVIVSPNGTDIPLDVPVQVETWRPIFVGNLTLTPEIPVAIREEKTVAVASLQVTFHLARSLEPNTTYSVAIPVGNETIAWNFTTGNKATSATPPSSTPPSQAQQPEVSILSPSSDSFFNVSIEGVNYQLTYETNSSLSWVGYSIDGANNVTVTENYTWVHDFGSSGCHTLTVYANDTSGIWATPQTVTYLVNFYPDYAPTPTSASKQQPTPSIVPTNPGDNSALTIITAGLVVAPVVVGLLVYSAKRRRAK